MKRYSLLLLLLLSFSIDVLSQKINRQYSFQPQDNGILYFIHPQKGFESKDKDSTKGLVYDVTYLTANDSVSFTFTYCYRTVLKADSIKLYDQSETLIFANKATTYYVQPKSSYWQHRTMVAIPYPLFVALYQQDAPFTISIEGARKVGYTMTPKKWNKQSKIMHTIFDVVKYNQ